MGLNKVQKRIRDDKLFLHKIMLGVIQPKFTYCCADPEKLDGIRHSNTW